MTPPPTPQNELSGSDSNTNAAAANAANKEAATAVAVKLNADEARRVVANAMNEPPIVFLSDFETDNKITQARQKIDTGAATTSAGAGEAVTSAEATLTTLKKGEEVNVPSQGKINFILFLYFFFTVKISNKQVNFYLFRIIMF